MLEDLRGEGWLKYRKGRYGSREEDKLLQKAILGLARFFALEEFPVVHRNVAS